MHASVTHPVAGLCESCLTSIIPRLRHEAIDPHLFFILINRLEPFLYELRRRMLRDNGHSFITPVHGQVHFRK
jgi:hypothetical protein